MPLKTLERLSKWLSDEKENGAKEQAMELQIRVNWIKGDRKVS